MADQQVTGLILHRLCLRTVHRTASQFYEFATIFYGTNVYACVCMHVCVGATFICVCMCRLCVGVRLFMREVIEYGGGGGGGGG